jgi:N-acetylmuramoyl-L-alanine amidase
MPLPLTPGSRGDDVRDLHARLAAAGFAARSSAPDQYTTETCASVQAFQTSRGLPASGVCDATTWHQLVEAGHRLGDRLLYLHHPMVRGDDVADLQLRLGTLGFDAGRVDGIFGPQTELALIDFQRNAGLPTDGIAGQATVRELRRLGAKVDPRDPVAVVRERERLRSAPRSLVDHSLVLGEFGGAAAVILATARQLRILGASVVTLHHPDPSHQAAEANRADAALYLAVEICETPSCGATYFATPGFVSAGGRRLAHLVAQGVGPVLVTGPTTSGSRTAVLRETRMPAVHLRIGPAPMVSTHLASVASAIAGAVEAWFADPLDETSPSS